MLKDDFSFGVYLAFNGNCLQAFNYYQSCFGGDLSVQTMGATQHGRKMTRQMQEVVICATLENHYFKLMGTDLTTAGRLVPGNNISILVECNSAERARFICNLAGNNYCPVSNTDHLIEITDRYRVHWIFSLR
ncbi:hypothetical protein [Foetidibacter luteolus]|uniref:hypothetical protein n=1 Tax=Foetidibacter luteolus TaxID=2608880 RepID=UPI00129A4AE8|nr:hypothetical protein [Foetidibacter luteolus]